LESEDPAKAASFARDEARILEKEAQARAPKPAFRERRPSSAGVAVPQVPAGAPTPPPASEVAEFQKAPEGAPDPDSELAYQIRARQAWARVLELAPEDDTAAERLAD